MQFCCAILPSCDFVYVEWFSVDSRLCFRMAEVSSMIWRLLEFWFS
jgi:hypothetical protein